MYKIKQSSKDENHAFCTMCDSDVSVKSGGRNDILRHVGSDINIAVVKRHESSQHARHCQFLLENLDSNDSSVINAEILFPGFIIEHNLNHASSDHAGPLSRSMCKAF